jgi:hypothetical protein
MCVSDFDRLPFKHWDKLLEIRETGDWTRDGAAIMERLPWKRLHLLIVWTVPVMISSGVNESD